MYVSGIYLYLLLCWYVTVRNLQVCLRDRCHLTLLDMLSWRAGLVFFFVFLERICSSLHPKMNFEKDCNICAVYFFFFGLDRIIYGVYDTPFFSTIKIQCTCLFFMFKCQCECCLCFDQPSFHQTDFILVQNQNSLCRCSKSAGMYCN